VDARGEGWNRDEQGQEDALELHRFLRGFSCQSDTPIMGRGRGDVTVVPHQSGSEQHPH
jgi:hypothetical protein